MNVPTRQLLIFFGLATMACFFGPAQSHADNLLSNGSFESGSFSNAVTYIASTNSVIPG